jgi:tetratricopeptide (TPR) repeat protein
MKAYLGACLLVVVCAALGPGAEPALKEARQRWLRGNYAEAREQYEALLNKADQRAAASIGLSRTLQSEGDYDKALSVVETALKDLPHDANLLARQAEVLYLRGRWEDADKAASAALGENKDHFLARWVLAQVHRDRGDLQKADAECRWFVRTYTQRSDADNDIKDPEELLLVGLAGADYARNHHIPDQFKFIVQEVYPDALKAEPDLWQAEYQAGLLLLEKYNRPEALESFEKALSINASSAEVLVAKGMAALQRLEIKDAERYAEQALNINPKLPEALRLRADVHLAGGNTTRALRELERAREVNPRDEYTLGRIAACLHLQGKKDGVQALAREVGKFDSKPARFYFELGERLEEKQHFQAAEDFYQKAAELRPEMSATLCSLGMLYMRMGREKEADKMLERAFTADKFNVRVLNLRKVLRHLEKYETIKTEHFLLRYDPKHDAVQARYMAPYLEEVYADLSRKFRYQLKEPILIEVFNSHEMFSGRTVALPDLHTIGACTGRMFAMASPHAEDIRKPFNWGRVVRHELVHIFNLEQTRFLVPHWYTEGLAVNNEGFPRPQSWNEILRERVPADKLLDLDSIDLGFIRPRSPEEWSLAYCQSQLYVQYMQQKYGAETVGQMLAAYADGLDTAAAIERVCKVDKKEFEKGYRAHIEEVVKPLLEGKRAEKRKTMTQLKEAYEKNNDQDAGAELALRTLPRDRVKARALAEKVLENDKNNSRATLVMARLAHAAGDVKQERSLLEACVKDGKADPAVLLALGKIYYDDKELERAAEVFEKGRAAEPLEDGWLVQLARTYGQMEARDKLIAVLEELVPRDADDLEQRVRLAGLLLETGKAAAAEKVAREALEIDVLSEEARDLLVKALKEQKKDDEAERIGKLLAR